MSRAKTHVNKNDIVRVVTGNHRGGIRHTGAEGTADGLPLDDGGEVNAG